MREVGQSGRTVLFVSHNMEALVRICTRCVYLVQGQVRSVGETRQVMAEYSASAKQSSSVIDLTKMPRRYDGGGSGRLLTLRVLGDHGKEANWCIEYGNPIEFAFSFEITKPLDEPDIYYSLFAPTGAELLSVSTRQETPLRHLEPGRYEMRVTIPEAGINPGVFLLGLAIISEGRHVDSIADTAQIEILPNKMSVDRGIEKIWAPFTPRSTFGLSRLSDNQ
jgi:lipopolysaccharide transport system ATP-binding protein